MKQRIIFFITFLVFTKCQAQNNSQNQGQIKTMKEQKIELEQIAKHEFSLLTDYKTKPMYYLQINKSACRVLVRVDDIPLGFHFVRDGGESMLYPINDCLMKSGKHTYSVDVYPMNGKPYITKDAWVNIKPVYLSNKDDSLQKASIIGEELSLPKNIEEQQLAHYATSNTIEATLPFDYSSRLTGASDLRKISNLEELVIKRYNAIREYMVKCDAVGFEKSRLHLYPNSDMVYLTEDNIIQSASGDETFDPTILGREVLPIKDYEMVICGNGKLAMLLTKDEMDDILQVKYFETKEEQQAGAYTISTTATLLYLPKGSKQLEMFY